MTTPRVDGRTLRYQHRKPELLAAAVEYVLDHGLGDLTLRPIAQALGVTHATLLRHFSSKDELLLAVVGQVHKEFLAGLDTGDELSTADMLERVWHRLCEPRQQRQFILLFETMGRTAREAGHDAALMDSVVGDWLGPLRDRLRADGWPPEEAEALATLVLANVRGLQLDLLASGDQARVDRAFALTVRMLTRPG